ncbi:MAG TPA: hypothetical protein VFI11_01465 [Anaerolineales bacterium]|nr:hypothetical protein [Anaerolineales bacterium]
MSGPEVLDERSLAFRGQVLAYLVLAGLDPASNYIETHDLDAGPSWRIQPDEGGVIFGFALHPEGSQLTYLEVDSRPSGTQPPWRVVTVDLATGNRRTILDSAAQPDALLPLDWQGDTLLLRAVVPFTARNLGLWAARSDGSGLNPVLEESSFVGHPRLAPRGDRLAVLRPDPSSTPTTFGPGEPVATTIWAIDLATGKETLIASAGDGHDYLDMAWESDGLVAVRGEWDDDRNAYFHRSIIRVSSEAGSASQIVYSIEDGEILRLVGCSEHAWMAAVRMGETTQLVQGNPSRAVTDFAGGNLHWAACPPGRREAMAHVRPGEPSP